MRRKETDRIRLQRIVGFSTHPTRSDAPDFTWETECRLYLIFQKHGRVDVSGNKCTPDFLPMALLDTENVPSDGTFVVLMHKYLPTRIDNLGIDALCSF